MKGGGAKKMQQRHKSEITDVSVLAAPSLSLSIVHGETFGAQTSDRESFSLMHLVYLHLPQPSKIKWMALKN